MRTVLHAGLGWVWVDDRGLVMCHGFSPFELTMIGLLVVTLLYLAYQTGRMTKL